MIVGFSINKLEANRERDAGQGNIEVNYAPELKGVNEREVAAFDDKIAAIGFSFVITFSKEKKKFANISLEGEVLWKGNVEQIIDAWEEKETLPSEMYESLMNSLYRRCLKRAVSTTETLNLPSPIPMPRVRRKGKK